MIDVTRPEKAPESLASGGYNGVDVVDALHVAFLGKCYLCETALLGSGTLDIDHRKPKAKGQFPELECVWTNLFPTCKVHNCNGRRGNNKYPEGGLLDPSAGHEVERRLNQFISGIPSGVLNGDLDCRFEAVREDDVAAQNTAIELDRIHHGTGSSGRAQLTARDLRTAIKLRIMHVATSVQEFVSLSPDAHQRRDVLQIELRKHFSRRAPYTMLVRSYFSARKEIRDLFEESP